MGYLYKIKHIELIGEEITHFVADENGYYAIMRSGPRLDITAVFSMQPPIDDINDYYSFLFVETLFDFYVFRQRVYENRPREWEVMLRIRPVERTGFFALAQDYWNRIRNK